MRYLILSDIHANREALEAVLGHAQGRFDEIVCCGDFVGYGPDPEWVVDWARDLRCLIRGNHDKVCSGLDDLDWFTVIARTSAIWTRKKLSSQALEWLRALPAGPAWAGPAMIAHGSPLDEDEYILREWEASQVGPYLETTATFFGHTHVQGGFLLGRATAKRIPPVPEEDESSALDLSPDSYYLINPGSVGQPRDGDPRAAYAVYTPERSLVEYFRVAYDIARVQAKIRGAGLPGRLADRLETGS